MIPNADLDRITCAMQKIQAAFDKASTVLNDVAPDLRAFVFATASADAALRARLEHGEQEQQADTAVSPRPNSSPRAGVAQPKSKNGNGSDSEDAQNVEAAPDYVENSRNRYQKRQNRHDVGLRGDGSWCE